MKRAVQRFLPRSLFARQVLTLVSGTGLAQALPILAAPILTRLYGPTDFGVLAVFVALTGLLGLVATGRYELAILLPASEKDAANVTALTVALSLGVSAMLLIVVLAGRAPIASLLGNFAIGPYLPLVPLMAFAMSAYQALNLWFNRKQQYRRLAANRVARGALGVVLMLAFGLQKTVAGGLVLGTVLAQLIVTSAFIWQGVRESRPELGMVSRAGMRAMARRFRDFPRFSVPADGINSLTAQMPLLMLGAFFGPVYAGYFGLTQRVLAGPLGMISTAFGDVFKQRASREFNEVGHCRAAWTITFRHLVLLSVLPSVIIAVSGPALFSIAFGARWHEAGRLAQLMSPYFLLSFTVSPLSRTLLVAERQRENLVWQIFLAALTTASLWLGGVLHRPLLSVGLYSASYSLMYLVYLWMSHRYAAGSRTPVQPTLTSEVAV